MRSSTPSSESSEVIAIPASTSLRNGASIAPVSHEPRLRFQSRRQRRERSRADSAQLVANAQKQRGEFLARPQIGPQAGDHTDALVPEGAGGARAGDDAPDPGFEGAEPSAHAASFAPAGPAEKRADADRSCGLLRIQNRYS